MPDGRGQGRSRGGGERAGERGVGGLVGSGPSIVGVSGAMRARDVSPVSAELMEEASKRVVLRRRAAEPAQTPHPPVPRPPQHAPEEVEPSA
jgi:hypothetical protein